MKTYKTTKKVKTERFPYVPNRPEWATVLPLFGEAAKVNPGAQTFVGARQEDDGRSGETLKWWWWS